MSFANPIGLLGLLSLPVIVALHLLRERRRQLVVSHLELWSFLDAEVRGSLPTRVPITWLLILDLAIAALLTLALAQPQLTIPLPNREARQVVVLLDTSGSMQAEDILPSRFSQAQLKAISLLSNLGPQDIATVITFGIRPQVVGDTREMDFQEILTAINQAEPEGSGSTLQGALALAGETLDESLPAQLQILTDAAFPPVIEGDLPFTHPDFSVDWNLFGTEVANQAVINISTRALEDDEIQIFGRFGNYGDEPADRLVTLLVDGEPIDSTTLKIPADSTVTQVWSFTGEANAVAVELIGNDPYRVDDRATHGLHAGELTRVALVSENPSPIDRALSVLDGVDLRVLPPEDYLPGMLFDLVIFRGTLPDSWPTEDVIVIDPPARNGTFPVTGSEEILIPPFPAEVDLLEGVDFSGIRWGSVWVVEEFPTDFTPVLTSGDMPLLLTGKIGLSEVVLFLPDLETGNLTRHPAFPILMANFVQATRQLDLPPQLSPGAQIPLLPAGNFPQLRLQTPDGETVTWGTDRPATWDQTQEAGPYQLDLVGKNGETQQFVIGVNAADPIESDLRPGTWIDDFSSGATNQGTPTVESQSTLTPWILGLAAILLFLEAWLAWR